MAFTTLKTVTVPILKGLSLISNYSPEIGTILLNPRIDLSDIEDFKFTRIESPIQDSIVWGNNMDSIKFYYNNKWENTQPSRDALLRLNGTLPTNYKDAVINLNTATITITLLRDEDTGRICMKNSGGVIFQCQVLKEDDTIGTYSLNSSYQSASLPLTPSGGLTYTGSQFFGNVAQISAVEGVRGGKIFTTTKIFRDSQTAKDYLLYGDDSGEIGKETINERNIETLYLKSTVYRSVTSSRTQAVKVETHKWEFDVQRYNDNGTQINKWNRGVIGFVNDTNTGHYNLGFMENTATKNLVKIRVDGVEVSKNSFSWVTGLTTYTENTKDVIEDQTYFYWSDISTNMYIFDTLYHAQQVIDGIEEGIINMFEGDDLTNTHLNDNDLDFNTDMSDCFVLDQADVQALARRFNAYVKADGSIISDLFVGMAMHENPIDCNIDLFEMPIDVSGFCEVENYVVKFSPRVTPPTPESGGHSTE